MTDGLLNTESNPRQSSPLGFSVTDCDCDRCNRPYRHFVQVDGWTRSKYGDDRLMYADSDGDIVVQSVVLEPQNSDTTVRLWVRWDADKKDVRRLLAKVQEMYERYPLDDIAEDMPF